MKTRYSLARVAALLVFVCFLSAQGGATPIQGASLSAADGPIRSGSPAWPGPAGVMVAEPSPCRECATLPEERAPGGTAALRATIDTALASGPVLLYFHAASCGYCRAQTPIVAELEEELANVLTVIRLDIAERPGDAETFGVSAVPTMVLISGQEEGAYLQETLRGLTGKAELLAVLRPLTQARAVGMDTMTVSAMAQPSARNEEDPCQSPGDAPPLEREEASQPTATLWSLTTALWHQITGQDTPEATLRAALRRARDVGSYRAEIDLNQTVTSMSVPSFGARAESAHFQIESAIAGPGRARFTIAPVRTSFVLASREPQEFLVVGSSIYRRVGERWLEEDSAPISVSLDGDALSLVSVARDVAWLDPLEGSHGRIRRLGFALYSDDVTRFMLVQQDQLTPENMVLARLQGPAIHGAGELWVGESGLPARLLLNLTWDKRGRDPYRVHLESTTDYSGYGLRFPPERFDPTASPETGAPIPELGRLRRSQAGMWLLAVSLLLAFSRLLVRATGRRRGAAVAVPLILVVALLTPTVSPVVGAAVAEDSGGDRSGSEPPPRPGSELARLLEETRALAAQHLANGSNPASALADKEDEDGDGLPNGYELRLGTSPFAKDSDYDGLSDYDEVIGMPCEFQGQSTRIETNPLDPDSNHDGLTDGKEFWRGQCTNGYRYGYAWHDDNDQDGVPDGLDLSPFSRSGALGGPEFASPNLTVETLDQDPSEQRTVPYPFYVEVQIRPYRPDSLRWAYKNLYWPTDHEGSIRKPALWASWMIQQISAGPTQDLGTSSSATTAATGKLTLVPFLQATLRERDLPSEGAMAHYGVSASPHKDEHGNPVSEGGEPLYDMAVPLIAVERGGQVYAFQAKMLHDRGRSDSLTRHWRDLRLKWAVIGDVLLPDEETGVHVRSPEGGYGLVVYDEPYYLTGLQVSRQGGASMLVAAALPSEGSRIPYDDGPIALLRGGLEAQFLTGRLDMGDIKARFDTSNSASDEQRWGIPQSQRYRIVYDASMHYGHLDEAVATTTMTTTRQLLNKEFAAHTKLQPTLILASEQRTSTVNLDDDPATDYLDITINTCLKPLITSRSLKLQTYRWRRYIVPVPTGAVGDFLPLFGEWVPLSLDEVLQKVEDEYAAAIDPGGRFSAEELNILKMATTAWYLGQSAILKIGTLTIQDLEKVLTDPQMVLAFLDEDGLLPTGFKEVVDVLLEVFKAGGPVAWLEQQWNKVMGVIDDVGEFFEGSFLDFSPDTSPPSAQESEPEEEPSEPSAPLDEKILGWTQTAITVLNVLATITGWAWLGEVATILTKIVEIYQKIRALCDTIKALMDSIGKPFETAMQTLSVELGTLAKPMSLVGLVFAVATIWLGVALQLGDVGPSVGLTIVVEAIVQTILVVVLFVVAAIFPFGTIVAIAIGLIQLLQDLLGFVFDPISLLLDWLFSVEAIQRTAVLGDPQFGQLKMEALEPGGGVLGGRKFRLKLPAIITMITVNGGDAGDLLQSAAALHLGRFVAAPKTPVSICSPSEDLFEEYKKALAGYVVDEFHAMYNHCVLFKLPRVPYWVFSSPSSASTGEDPVEVFPGIYTRELLTASRLDIEPSGSINGLLTFDVSIDVTFRYDACSTCCGCDEGTSTSTSPPAINKLYFDILPGWLPGLWGWPALYNPDPDGDGLWGYAHPETGNPIGPDGNLCPGLAKSWERWDTDDDGLSDKFELETQGYDPCNKDSDGDGWEDGRELMFGTRPDDPDTDGDGLTDKEELPYSSFYGWQAPWRVSLKALYPGLPDPVAFPNPRQANLDRDHRGDKKERAKYSSPNAFNPIPVGEAIDLGLTQVLQAGGGTRLTVSTPPWPNDEAAAIGPTLTITLPVAFSGLTLSARLYPSLGSRLDYGIPLRSETPNVYKWMLPPITLSRYLLATLAGIPDIPSGPVTVTAQLAYTEGATSQVSTAAAPLKVNTGGPSTAVVQVDGALVLQPAGANDQGTGEEPAGDEVVIWGTASDPEQVSQVFVCVKTTDTCDGGDWQPATVSYGALLAGVPQYWSYSFTPAEDNVYYVRAYGVDWFQVAGPVSEPWVIGVDRKPPSRVRFDLRGTAYLSTTTSLDGSPVIALTGRISDTIGAPYVSGVDAVALLADGQAVETVDVTDQGQASSSFTVQWTPSILRTGRSLRSTNGVHRLTVGGRDVAGNICPVSDTLHVLVDDTPPVVYAHPPQTLATSTQPFPLRLTLSGLADDTALVRGRQPEHPFASTLTVGDRDALFDVGVDRGRAVIVGDVTGDLIDDVVLFVPATVGFAPVPFRAGLFYGKPAGFRDTLFLADADVLFQGELPVVLRDWGPSAAGLGDINGDGVGDLLLGDPSAGSGQGRAYVVLGRRGGGWSSPFSLANADWRLSVAETTAFGGTVGAAGDVNGDGLNDLVVGADSYQNYKSVAWLFLGRERGAAVARAAFYAPSKLASGPPGLAGLGDTNGDGLAELLIAPEGTDVALLYGRPDGEWPAGPTNLGALADVLFSAPGTGQTVSPAGDVNGNGLRDMLIGDPYADRPGVYLLYGRRPENAWPAPPTIVPLDDLADASFVERRYRSSRLGMALAELGDADGDGRSDFAFGQPGVGMGPNRMALVLAGQSDLRRGMSVESATHIISGTVASQRFGEYLTAGDVSGDHIPDLLIGAPGESRAYLFEGDLNAGAVAGIGGVEIGLYGPVTDPALPLTQTLPAEWRSATLDQPGGAISPWAGEVAVPLDGDYRVYARARDRAGNAQGARSWYLGNVLVNSRARPIEGASASMDEPTLTDQTQLTLTGSIASASPIQHLRVFDGYQWHRRPPATGSWSLEATIPRSDQRTLTFRAVARDAFGTALHARRTLTVDTLVDVPRLSANLPIGIWQTDGSPTLTISWPDVRDANGIVGTWADIDTISRTVPTSSAADNQVTRALTDPGVYYGHVRVRDGVGNEHTTHLGPFPVNRTRTPSVILPDGHLDFDRGEYPPSTLLNYDPYADIEPAALWGTWDASRVYLGYPGQSWGADSLLAIYLDTCPGGTTSALASFTATHILPFSADYALLVGGPATEGYALYAASSGNWAPAPSPQSFVARQMDTEIVLDRAEVQATGAVGMLAFAEDLRGVWAVLPGGARPTTTEIITGTVVFGDPLHWEGLDSDVEPRAGQEQVIAPMLTVNPEWDSVLAAGEATLFRVMVTNPDLAPYEGVPLALQADPEMVLLGASGAECLSCPSGSSEWILRAEVAPGATQTVTVEARAAADAVGDVIPISITARLANSGLASAPQGPARAWYNLDQGVGAVGLAMAGSEVFARPGAFDMLFVPELSADFLRCAQRVEANTGAGWYSVCQMGDCVAIGGEVPAGSSRSWQVRVSREGGGSSEPIVTMVVADSVAPVAQISATRVLTGRLAFVIGTAWDDFPANRPPGKVEVSVDGGRFRPALLSSAGGRAATDSEPGLSVRPTVAEWRFPLRLSSQDGDTVEVVARATDEAGNVGPNSAVAVIALDNRGPILTIVQDMGLLSGTVTDGSGVASVEVSLDGGAHYRPAAVSDGNWSFDTTSWSGSRQPFALVRATDVWGNVTREVIALDTGGHKLHLPLVGRSWGTRRAGVSA